VSWDRRAAAERRVYGVRQSALAAILVTIAMQTIAGRATVVSSIAFQL
jgi:hypothetical protein